MSDEPTTDQLMVAALVAIAAELRIANKLTYLRQFQPINQQATIVDIRRHLFKDER